jgi:hypothetical protein
MTYSSSTCGPSMTLYNCFTQYVLPNISGIGVVVPWGQIDNCGTNQNAQCNSDQNCPTLGNCFKWSVVDNNLWNNFINCTISTCGFNFNTGCAGGRACKIVFIIWLTQDSGNTNLYAGLPNTPAYVFSPGYASSISAQPQDVLVCKSWQGGGTSGWGGAPPFTDPCWSSGNLGNNDYAIWNATAQVKLNDPNHCFNQIAFTGQNYSGYPVMYEQPIKTAAKNFISALALHYSRACPNTNTSSCGFGPQIAPSIAYMRIGPSSGGEDYPYCSSSGPAVYSGRCPVTNSYWSGPQGLTSQKQCFSDQGYLTEWPTGDGQGYISWLYQYISEQNWAFPITTPSHTGPPDNQSLVYADTEALLAAEFDLGMGMQAASITDVATYPIQFSTTANWAMHFREFPYVPVHHLQTADPGSPTQAAQISLTNITTGAGTSTATVTCASVDCYNFCNKISTVYISGTDIPAFNGIQQVDQSMSSTCGPTSMTFEIDGTYPASTTSGMGLGYVYSTAHLPVLLPFESQNCLGSAQTICSAELWEETLDWTYGTKTIIGTVGNAGPPDPAYRTAISNFLLGLPSATSTHNKMSSNHSYHY